MAKRRSSYMSVKPGKLARSAQKASRAAYKSGSIGDHREAAFRAHVASSHSAGAEKAQHDAAHGRHIRAQQLSPGQRRAAAAVFADATKAEKARSAPTKAANKPPARGNASPPRPSAGPAQPQGAVQRGKKGGKFILLPSGKKKYIK